MPKKARNVVLNQLHERNAAVRDDSRSNAAAAEGPEVDGFETMEVPDSDPRDFDRDRTQESLADDQLNAFYAEIMDHFSYLLDIKDL